VCRSKKASHQAEAGIASVSLSPRIDDRCVRWLKAIMLSPDAVQFSGTASGSTIDDSLLLNTGRIVARTGHRYCGTGVARLDPCEIIRTLALCSL
jgi:hypothetical protein